MDQVGVLFAGNANDAAADVRSAFERKMEKRLVFEDWRELLRSVSRAERPQPSAEASAEDHVMDNVSH
jgi:hypothetical protein